MTTDEIVAWYEAGYSAGAPHEYVRAQRGHVGPGVVRGHVGRLVTALRPYCEAWAMKVLQAGVDRQRETV